MSTKLEELLGQKRADSDPVGTGEAVAGGWLQRAKSAMAEFGGLEVVIHAKDGSQGHCLLGILDPANPEPVVIQHRGTGCCGC